MFQTSHEIAFGDCDPAGILFYPNHFRLMDASFQRLLRASGLDQAKVRERFGAVGTGLIEASASFRAPVRDGDRLVHRLRIADWGERTFRVAYEGHVGDQAVLSAEERRGLFLEDGERLRLAPLTELRALFERDG